MFPDLEIPNKSKIRKDVEYTWDLNAIYTAFHRPITCAQIWEKRIAVVELWERKPHRRCRVPK